MEYQNCRKCFLSKKITDFYFRNDTGKYRLCCKACLAKNSKLYRANNREYIAYLKSTWQKANPEKKHASQVRYYQKNKDKIREYHRDYVRNKRSLNARLANKYQSRINKALTRGDRPAKTAEMLGCDVDFFIKYIESRFCEGMTWENYGEWQIDHIKPCSSFNLSVKEQVLECFNYKNMQPLWASENRLKSAKMIEDIPYGKLNEKS